MGLEPRPLRARRAPRGLPLRAVAPNAVTALALCSGLSGVQFAIKAKLFESEIATASLDQLPRLVETIAWHWQLAVTMVIVAGVLDGLDGRIARLLHGESRFGAELDSLSDAISFGVAPALILYLWSLSALPRVGWIAALILAVFCALRLARFNSKIDESEQPHKSAGFLTGIPAPAGAGCALLPMFLWFWTEEPLLRSPLLVVPWVALVATLMVSSLPTYSWKSFRLRRTVRFEALAGVVLLGGALVSAPWHTLSAVTIAYLMAVPFSIAGYAKIRRLRGDARPEPSSPTSA